jgi:ferrous iron transport protein B
MISVLNTACSSSKQITAALVGNPNCGKTTLFNALTGLRQKVGNYPGVTVEKKTGNFSGPHGESIRLIDLPGTYGLNPTSPDERITTEVLLGLRTDICPPDCIMCITDATSLRRHLFLVSQVFELGIPIILVLTMMDLLKGRGRAIHAAKLSKELGCPVIPCNAVSRSGLVELRQLAVKYRKNSPSPFSESFPLLREATARLSKVATPGHRAAAHLALFEPCASRLSLYGLPATLMNEVLQEQSILDSKCVGWRHITAAAKYHRIQRICSRVLYRYSHQQAIVDTTDQLDHFLTHPVWGWMAFSFVMTVMFLTIFIVAAYPMDWIQSGTSFAQNWVKSTCPKGDLTDLLSDGVMAGLGGVLVFLPQILILFFFIGLLENTGYMARAAFMMDHLMSRVGLHGKSFIPLLSSFACAIPDARDRLATILIAPFMSCSARIPIYTLMIALLLPANMPFAYLAKASLMFSMYAIGVAAAFACGWFLKKTILKGDLSCPMVMELPPYRFPLFASILQQVYQRAVIFLKRAGTVILGISILLWFFSTYPKSGVQSPEDTLEHSFAGKIGLTLAPIFQPLGFNWKISIGLLCAQAAREVFISTLSVAYSVGGGTEEMNKPLREVLLRDHWPDGRPVFTPLVCITIMVFFALSLQCIGTIAATRRETNSWKWAAFQLCYMFIIAYGAALLVYQTGCLLSLG